jgi:hypothetical protein
MEKLSVQDLAMFIGCKVIHEEDFTQECTMVGIDIKSEFDSIFLQVDRRVIISCSPDKIKPILRPISDMTELEEDQFAEFVAASNANDKEGCLKEMGIITKRLIELQFDVFGWIEKGIAIDSTKVTE